MGAGNPHSVALRWRRWLTIWLLPLATVACGGKGCVGCSVQTPTVTVADPLMLPAAAQFRLTQNGFDVIAAEMVALLKLLFGSDANGAAEIDVSKLLGKTELTIGGGLGLFKGKASVRDLVLTLDLAALQVKLVEGSSPARVQISIDQADLGVTKGVVAGGVTFLGMSSDAACHLLDGVDVGTAKERMATVSATIDLILGVDPKGNLDVSVKVSDPVLHDVGFDLAKDCALKECTDQLLFEDPCMECGICNAGSITSAAVQGLKDFLGPVLGDILALMANGLVDALLKAGINGKPLDLELAVPLNDLMAKASPTLAALLGAATPLRARVRPAPGAFSVNKGALDGRFDLGMLAAAAGCVAAAGADDSAVFAKLKQGPPPELPATMAVWDNGTRLPDAPVDLGVLVAGSALEEGLWAILRSGLLCIGVDSTAVHQLSGGRLLLSAAAVDLMLPGLRQITSPAAPLRIAVAPSADPVHAPAVALEVLNEGKIGLGLQLRDFEVRIEVAVRGRWLTVVELAADAQIALTTALDPQGQLALTLQQVQVTQVTVAHNPLFPDSGIEDIVPAAAQVGVSLLMAQPLAFELPLQELLSQALAVPLTVEAVGLQVGGADDDWLMLGARIDPLAAGGPP